MSNLEFKSLITSNCTADTTDVLSVFGNVHLLEWYS